MAEAPPVSGIVLARVGVGSFRIAEAWSVTRSRTSAIHIARVARTRVGIVARKGQAARVVLTET